MLSYLFRRIITLIILLFLVVSFVFLLIHLIPGDPARIIAGIGATEEAVSTIREEMNLNQPLYIQYIDKMKGLFTGDMGRSLVTDTPVAQIVPKKFGATLELIIFGAIFSVIVGVPLGMIAASKYGSILDIIINILSIIFISLPVFVVGIFLIYVFSLNYQLLPSSGYVSLNEGLLNHFKRLILPSITLGLGLTTINIRMMRSSLIEELNTDYIKTAIAKGLSSIQAYWKHAMKNSLIPVVTVFSLQIGSLFGGSVLVEHIFNWPGLSSLLISSINRRDYPIVEGTMIVIALVYFIINLFVDILYTILDPRVKYE